MRVLSEDVRFRGKEREIEAYLALPEGEGPLPGLILVHEIWGLNDHIREVARRFAAQGFVVLAPDLYTGPWREAMRPERIMAGMTVLRTAPPDVQRDPSRLRAALEGRSPEEVAALETLMGLMRPEQRRRFAEDLLGAASWLRARPEVQAGRVSCLGFCMGGGITGQLATLDPALDRAVIFYGENPPLEAVEAIRARVLGLYGGDDRRITDTVPELEREMARQGKPFRAKVYPGAPHGFFNDTRAATYRPEAAEDAFSEAIVFLS